MTGYVYMYDGKNAAMVKIHSNGEKYCIAHKAYGSYRKSQESSEYSKACMCHTRKQLVSCSASRQPSKTKK